MGVQPGVARYGAGGVVSQSCGIARDDTSRKGIKIMFKIRGYDKLFGEFYWLPEVYNTYEEAFERCRSNESAIKVGA